MIKENNFITLFRFIICAIFIFGYFFNLSNAQSDYYKISNLTTYDGLPSNQVFKTFQDRDGYMWFGTKLGVSKFDGYKFQNFSINEGLKDLTISHISQDESGIIWVCSVWGNIYKLVGSKFEPYKYQECIDDYKPYFGWATGFEVNSINGSLNPELIIGLDNMGFLKIDKDGFKKEYQSRNIPCIQYYISSKSKIVLQQSTFKDSIFKCIDCIPNVEIYYFDGNELNYIKSFVEKEYHPSSLLLKDSLLIIGLTSNLRTFNLNSQQMFCDTSYPYITDFTELDDTRLLISHYLRGDIFEARILNNTLKLSKTISIKDGIRDIFKDKQGSIWISSYNSGIYCLIFNKDLKRFNYKFNSTYNDRKICIDTINKFLYISLSSNLILVSNLVKSENFIIKHREGIINSMFMSTTGIKVAFSKNSFQIDKGIMRTIRHKFLKDYALTGFSEYFGPDSCYAFSQINAYILTKDSLFPVFSNEASSIENRIFDIKIDNERNVIVVKFNGIYILRNNKLSRYEKLDTLTKSTIGSLFKEEDSGLWITTNTDGVYIDYENRIYHLTESSGLMSNQIIKIVTNYRGNFYILSNQGIDQVYLNNGEWEIMNLNYLNDLSKETILDIAAYDSILWIATSESIYMAKIPKISENTCTPFLVEFKGANGKVINLPYHLNSTNNDLIINWCSLDLKRLGKIKYRYKIRNENSWIETYDREILLMSLKPMKYNLQVQAQNSNGQWSQSLIIPFEVLKPWWNSIYFILFCIILFIFLVWLFVTSKIENIQKETNIRNTIFKLTNQALISQINPHFIFNCLNSIKLLIRQQENIQADNYLGYFSKLLRKTLNASKKENWTIEEEMDLLENYVKMENMRLKNKIHLNCKIDTQIEKQQYLIPSLICQTLVENSIKHGFSDNDGVINIDINIDKMDKDTLKFEIVDDGIGFKKLKISNKNKGDDGIQLGLNLTRQRLQLFNENADKENLIVESPSDIILDRGTKISLLVKIRT